jgi:hypothetical protein
VKNKTVVTLVKYWCYLVIVSIHLPILKTNISFTLFCINFTIEWFLDSVDFVQNEKLKEKYLLFSKAVKTLGRIQSAFLLNSEHVSCEEKGTMAVYGLPAPVPVT